MARKPSGAEVLEKAKKLLTQARTVEELRQAQAVVLPLIYRLTMKETAQAIGVSVGWACQLRTRFIIEGGVSTVGAPAPARRRRENMTLEDERAFLAPFFDRARETGVLVVRDVKLALDARLKRSVALASVYNLLHRHGWRSSMNELR
ncbi:MAG: hypothetical protein FWD77_03555 [Betaproteobacteria bacterium]|nr:hypothetical protein [Betaproteobacteria bacterium]